MVFAVSRWLAAAAATLVVGGMVVSSLAAGRDEDLCLQLATFVAAHDRARAHDREVHEPLYGEVHGGDAMVFYQFAAQALGKPGKDAWMHGPDAMAREAAWPAVAPVVAVLQAGTHGRRDRAPAEFFQGIHRLRPVLQLAQRRAADRQEWRDVVQLWLDELALLLDVMPAAFVGVRFLEAWPPDRLARLDPAAAALLATGLARLDARWPDHVDAADCLCDLARFVLPEKAPALVPWRERLRSWRSGFDPRRRERLAVREFVDALPALHDHDVPWPARQRQWQAFLGAARLGRGGSVHACMADLADTERRLRRDHAALRLLRLAAAFTSGEELPALADPFADGPLQVHADGDVATFRSAAAPAVLQCRAQRRRAPR